MPAPGVTDGKISGVVGSILNAKLLIRVGDDGVYHSFAKVRTQEKALDSVVQELRDLVQGRQQVRMAVAHSSDCKAALYLK